MKRAEKISLLAKVMQGNVRVDTLRQLHQPVRVCGVFTYEVGQAEPLPTDTLDATLFYAGGQVAHRSMSYAQFAALGQSVQKTLFFIPSNDR